VVDDWYAIGDLESAITTTESRDDAAFLVAETASDIASVGEADCRSDPGLDGFAHVVPWPEDTTVAFLACLYVRPAVWNEGTGTVLLETLETGLAPGFDRVRLPILTDNAVGISFSESRGFDRVETRSSGLAAGLEEHVYEKEL